MLFNSHYFINYFLLSFLILCFAINFKNKNQLLIILFSFLFYAYWSLYYAILLIFIIISNYWLINLFDMSHLIKKRLLLFLIFYNLFFLFFFKYSKDLLKFLNFEITGNFWTNIVLPIGISFYIFQIISYAIDVYNNKKLKVNFLNYFAFIIFFPQLIAGPILKITEFYPDIKKNFLFNHYNFISGFSVFIIGLSKKVIIADNLSEYTNLLFADSELSSVSPMTACFLVFLYSFEIYYDFSGYSDMAVGICRILGLNNVPFNFNSPFKQTSIIEFWKNWNITLTRFIREYIFFPLVSVLRKLEFLKNNINFTIVLSAILTFFIVGIWHGSGVNFIIFGLLHGLYFAINFYFNSLNVSFLNNRNLKIIYWLLTFVCISFSFVFFRSANLTQALMILNNIFDRSLLDFALINTSENRFYFKIIFVLVMMNILLPNSRDFIQYLYTAIKKKNYFKSIIIGFFLSLIFFFSYFLLNNQKQFIYFQF